MKKKKIRWFEVTDPDENMMYVIGASSHSKAKIFLNRILGNLTDFEALTEYKCKVIKQKLSREPVKDGEEFERNKKDDWKELLQEGIYYCAYDEECPHCGKFGTVYFEDRFYCDECENEGEE